MKGGTSSAENKNTEKEMAVEDSKLVPRRLSTPYHGLPSLVDYDPETGYVTFGQPIPLQTPVVHPRRFVQPEMPQNDNQRGICRHMFCLNERRRLYGLSVPEGPTGMPWSTGLLKYLPGHQSYEFPLRKKPKNKKKKKEKTEQQVRIKCEREGVMEEMIIFYKIVMLAGSILSEAKKEKQRKDEGNKAGYNTTQTASSAGTQKSGKNVEEGKLVAEDRSADRVGSEGITQTGNNKTEDPIKEPNIQMNENSQGVIEQGAEGDTSGIDKTKEIEGTLPPSAEEVLQN